MKIILQILIEEARQETSYVGEDAVKRAKKLLPLTRLMQRIGDGSQIATKGHPCHLCNAPGEMFRMFQLDSRWVFSCTGKCGKRGDQIDYLKAKFNLTKGGAIRLLSKLICP